MERIGQEEVVPFLEAFQRDFRELLQAKRITWKNWSDEERADIEDIIRMGTLYDEEIARRRDAFFHEIARKGQVIIYGAGVFGKRVLRHAKGKVRVCCFAVSDQKFDTTELYGFPVRCIEDLSEYAESAAVLISVKNQKDRADMEKRAKNAGFKKIFNLPYALFDYETKAP